jgi:hypothetical protein
MDALKFTRLHLARALGSALLCVCGSVGVAQTSESDANDFHFSGFGTVGLTHTQAPANWGFLRSIDQPAHTGGTRADTDSRLGLQLNYSPSAQVELVAQALLTRRSPLEEDSETLQWGFAAYRPNPDWTLRVGRLNLDQFLLSDFRNVGFAYLFARPPVEFYGSLPTFFDGADVTRVWNAADAQYRLKSYLGRVRIAGIQVTPAYGFTVSREAEGLTIKAGLSRARLVNLAPPLQPLVEGLAELSALPVPAVAAQAAGLRSRLDYVGAGVTYAALGASYELHDWQWSSEFTRISGGLSTPLVAGYASVGRRFGPVTLFGIASAAHGSRQSVDVPSWGPSLAPILGPALAQQAQLLGAGAAFATNLTSNQRTLSVGTRWDLHPQLALKFQFDHTWISANGGTLWANPTSSSAQANIASALLDFVF